MNGRSFRFALASLVSLSLSFGASADTVAEDRNKGALLAYEIDTDGRLLHRRDFGDVRDESRVVSAEVSSDGMLNLRVFFPALKQTREFGMIMQDDGTMRTIYNRNPKGEYSIRNGKFTANGNPTPAQHRCR